ncbi:MAG: FAD-dependent oxidoreductase, partial [Luminiphilus sp.]|nr:FAD-dependent oxidoreductase [Luminiphilus sp.]
MSTIARFDVLIIGSGAAGMSLALQLPTSLKVAVLSKTQLGSGSTFWAQGGMAAVLHDRDTVQAVGQGANWLSTGTRVNLGWQNEMAHTPSQPTRRSSHT